jgi:hypothetical protein
LLGLKEYVGDRDLLQGYFGHCIDVLEIFCCVLGIFCISLPILAEEMMVLPEFIRWIKYGKYLMYLWVRWEKFVPVCDWEYL